MEIDSTQIIYFPKHPVYAYLSRTTRTSIMDSIDRSTHRDKIIGLVKTTNEITEEINYNFELDHETKFFGFPVSIPASKISKYQNISLILALVICLLLFFTVSVIYYPEDEDIEYELG